MEEQKDERNLATPPFFKSWRTIYLLVIANLFIMILLFYLFSTSYQ